MHDNMTFENVWLVGTGSMAQEYVRVLLAQRRSFTVIGRGKENAEKIKEKHGIPVFIGGYEKAIDISPEIPDYAIVAVGVNQLSNVCMGLIEAGVKNILVEKPAGMNIEEIKNLCRTANTRGAKLFVAYNRRFFASTLKALDIIKEDGGVKSFYFEFTEWSHVIEKLDKPKDILENWFLANSTHVIDLAFYLGGMPKKMSCYTSGSTKWYHKASVFSGAGITKTSALFSYQANWKGPGRWSLECVTPLHRLVFRPLEKLQVQNVGSIDNFPVDLDDTLDKDFKPGLYLQTQAFIDDKHDLLLKIDDHCSNVMLYMAIENGSIFNEDSTNN